MTKSEPTFPNVYEEEPRLWPDAEEVADADWYRQRIRAANIFKVFVLFSGPAIALWLDKNQYVTHRMKGIRKPARDIIGKVLLRQHQFQQFLASWPGTAFSVAMYWTTDGINALHSFIKGQALAVIGAEHEKEQDRKGILQKVLGKHVSLEQPVSEDDKQALDDIRGALDTDKKKDNFDLRRLGYTQAERAKRLDVYQSTISRWDTEIEEIGRKLAQ